MRKSHISIGSDDSDGIYAFSVNFYATPPAGEVDLATSEHIINERLNCESIVSGCH